MHNARIRLRGILWALKRYYFYYTLHGFPSLVNYIFGCIGALFRRVVSATPQALFVIVAHTSMPTSIPILDYEKINY